MGFGSIFPRRNRKQLMRDSSEAGADSSASGLPSMFFSPLSRTPSRNLTDIQIKELEIVFNKFDSNGDGKISASELGSVLSSLCGNEASEEQLQVLIKEFDSDGDGFINFKEFVELNTKGVDSNEAMENLKDAFSVYDLDGNGSISAEELHKVMRSLGDECTVAECRRMIRGVDTDGDGMIDFQEFKMMMLTGSESSTSNSGELVGE